MFFVFFLYFTKYFESLFGRSWFYDNLLEATFEGAIFLDILTVLVERGGSNALNFAAGESRLEQVGCVHRARSVSGTHNGVNLVDK